MTLDAKTIFELSQEQKEAIAMILRDIEDTEPFGPGVSAEYAEETRDALRLTRPVDSIVHSSEIYRRLQLVPELKGRLHDLTDADGVPVYTITGNIKNFEKLLNIN